MLTCPVELVVFEFQFVRLSLLLSALAVRVVIQLTLTRNLVSYTNSVVVEVEVVAAISADTPTTRDSGDNTQKSRCEPAILNRNYERNPSHEYPSHAYSSNRKRLFEFESVVNPFDDSAAVGADTPSVDKADAYTEELTQA